MEAAGDAAAVTTAATGALGPAIAKLGALLCDIEGENMRDVEGSRSRSRSNNEFIASELKPLHSLLLRMWERGDDLGAACNKEWMAGALELSYRTEDAVDGFRRGLEPANGSAVSTSPFEGLRNQAQRLLEAVNSNSIPNPTLGESSRPAFRRRDASELEEVKEKQAELIKRLREHKMVCVHGFAGMGKTTLADLVYQEMQGEQFQCRAFVSVSPRPNMMQIVLTDIFSQVVASAITKAASDKRKETDSATRADDDDADNKYNIRGCISELLGLADMSEVTGRASPRPDTATTDATTDREKQDPIDKISEVLVDKSEVTGRASPRADTGTTDATTDSGKKDPIDKISKVLVDKRKCAPVAADTVAKERDLIISIISELLGEEERKVTVNEKEYKQYLISIISKFLANRRYLVIFDDIWHWEQWEVIRESLPKNDLSSKIIMTTHVNAIAEKCCTDGNFLYKIKGLSMDAAAALSRRIFISKAHTAPSDLHSTCTAIAEISVGVPLAVICLSAAVVEQLAPKDRQVHYSNISARKQFDVVLRRALDGFLDSPCMKPLVESICLSYHHLPLHLKTCLLPCSMYPPNERFGKDDLIRIWIAEGFVYEGKQAQSYFDELVEWGYIFPAESRGTKAPEYQNNTVTLAILRCQRQEYNFVFSVGSSSNIGSLYGRQIRHLSFQGGLSLWDVSRLDFSCLHSFHVFGRASLVPFERLNQLQLLHLDEDCNSEDADLHNYPDLGDDDLVDICELLLFLRYVRLKGCKITKVPREIKKLQHLETLDLRSTGVRELPREIGEVELLKHLNISNTAVTDVPTEIGKLKQLKTLDVSNTKIAGLPLEITELERLEKLDASNTNVTKLPKDIGKLQNLETLDVSNTEIAELPKEVWKLQKLKTLNISRTKFRELPWEAGQRSNSINVLVGDKDSPEVTKLLKDSCEYGNVFSSENICINLFDRFGSTWQPVPVARFKIPGKHTSIPRWIKEQLSEISSLEISLWELSKDDLKFLQEMPNLQALALRVDVLRRMVITSPGFSKLESFCLDCRVPRITFEDKAMPKLKHLEFKFYAFRATEKEDPVGITHLRKLQRIVFRSASGYKSNHPGISTVINKVRKEAKAHGNRITLCINDKEEVIVHEEKSAEICQVNNTDGACSSTARVTEVSLPGSDIKGVLEWTISHGW